MTGFMSITVLIAAIVFIVLATSRYKLHPFFALSIAAYGAALTSGFAVDEIAKTITTGFGGIIAYIGIVIVLGTITWGDSRKIWGSG